MAVVPGLYGVTTWVTMLVLEESKADAAGSDICIIIPHALSTPTLQLPGLLSFVPQKRLWSDLYGVITSLCRIWDEALPT